MVGSLSQGGRSLGFNWTTRLRSKTKPREANTIVHKNWLILSYYFSYCLVNSRVSCIGHICNITCHATATRRFFSFLLLLILRAVSTLTRWVMADFTLFSSFRRFFSSNLSFSFLTASFLASAASRFLARSADNSAFSFIFFSQDVERLGFLKLAARCPGCFHDRPDAFPTPIVFCLVLFAGGAMLPWVLSSRMATIAASSSTCKRFTPHKWYEEWSYNIWDRNYNRIGLQMTSSGGIQNPKWRRYRKGHSYLIRIFFQLSFASFITSIHCYPNFITFWSICHASEIVQRLRFPLRGHRHFIVILHLYCY